ncbi:MAG: cadherin domain-containing protein, partial [Cytophagales bacterium]|nr:cadherin domain-containing protein [Cytophagales bacterium]
MRISFTTLSLSFWICLYSLLEAQNIPTWTVRDSDYQYSMTMVARLKLASHFDDDENNLLAAFVGTEVRGVGSPSIRVESTGTRIVFLQIYSNSVSGDRLSFKIYDRSEDREVDAVNELVFQSNASLGSNTDPYIITDNRGPIDIQLSSSVVDENTGPDFLIGNLSSTDEDVGDTFLYSFTSGDGDQDNGHFSLNGDELDTKNPLDYEDKHQYSIRIRSTDSKNEYTEKIFTIEVRDLNELPTQIEINPSHLDENSKLGQVIGQISGIDPDQDELHSFRLVGGTGDIQNSNFLIQGNDLVLNTGVDFEVLPIHSIRVEVSDRASNRFSQSLSINIRDLNEPPTGILLDHNIVNEDEPVGHNIGTLNAIDEDQGDTHMYSLINHSEGVFDIRGDQLVLARSLNYEDRSFYFLEVSVRDAQNQSITEQIQIDVGDINDVPTGIRLSLNIVAEDKLVNYVIGTFQSQDEDVGDRFIYSLVSGGGDDDNANFSIQDQELRINTALNFENKSEYICRVRSTDSGAAEVEESFTILIKDVNEPPTHLALSQVEISELKPIGHSVGSFEVTDPDNQDHHNFLLIPGPGDRDNAKFVIEGGELKLAVKLDHEEQENHEIRVQVSDNIGQTHVQTFTIVATDGNEAPTQIELNNYTVDENAPASTLIGELTARDPEGDPISYTLLESNDADFFQIKGNQLLILRPLDYENNIFYRVRIEARDGGNNTHFIEDFVIRAQDVNEPPTDIILERGVVQENVAKDTMIGFFEIEDPDESERIAYSLSQGTSSNNNDSFVIKAGNRLHNLLSFDYEHTNQLGIHVTATDKGGFQISKNFIIELADTPENPVNIMLSSYSIRENSGPGTIVGNLLAEDPDNTDSFRFLLVEGPGGVDNDKFYIFQDQLLAARSFDYE